jgi:hypothetical protein
LASGTEAEKEIKEKRGGKEGTRRERRTRHRPPNQEETIR